MTDAKAPSSSEEEVGGGGATPAVLKHRARQLRNTLTEPEIRLWSRLRASQVLNMKFRRQTVIGTRIVDFFCPAKGLIVEVDDETHDPDVDSERDETMRLAHGFHTVRFTNEDVMRNLDGVLMRLVDVLSLMPDRWPQRRQHHPQTPSSKEEGA